MERLGFAGLYRSDHYTNATPPDKESLELWVSLTWLAGHTRRIEFGLLGAVSGLLAALGSELVSLVLYRYAFDLPWHPHPWLLVLPLVGALLIGAAGVFGTRRALNASPLTVLREG